MHSVHDKQRKLGILLIFAAWGILLGLLTVFFHNWYSFKQNPNQHITSLEMPDGSRQIILQANSQGHYLAVGTLEDQEVTFLLDTGASTVVVPLKLANKIPLAMGPKMLAHTAGGEVSIISTRIKKIQIGNIVLKNIPASISDRLPEGYVLLGMSALRRLKLEHAHDTLIITLPP
ncbi:MAG TPA: retropepsin-like aspartic protease [Gammaproteobacteria bacterium]|nr:retropepsin-like aspartic protease [Gammaproteobacteria bacterium]